MIKDTKGEKCKSGVSLSSAVLQIFPMANAIDGAEISYQGKKGRQQIDKACKNGQNMTCLTGRADGKDWDCVREMC